MLNLTQQLFSRSFCINENVNRSWHIYQIWQSTKKTRIRWVVILPNILISFIFGSFEICHQFKSLTVTLLRPSRSQYLHFIFDVKNFLWRKLWRVYLFATVKSKYFAKQLNRNTLPALLSLWQKCHNGQFLVNVRPCISKPLLINIQFVPEFNL